MAASLTFAGLEALKTELRNLPATLHAEASGIVWQAARAAKDEIAAAYPVRTDPLHLREGLEIVDQSGSGRFGTRLIVVNNVYYASMFEFGTKHHAPGNVFVPRIRRHRQAMYDALKALLVRAGLAVTGDDG
jgi:hypothetical protein